MVNPTVRGIVLTPLSPSATEAFRIAGKMQVLTRLTCLIGTGQISVSMAEKVFLAFLAYVENQPPNKP